MRLFAIAILAISSTLGAAGVQAQSFLFGPETWGKLDFNLSQSVTEGNESILGSSAKWERLNEYNANSRERRFSRPVGRLEVRLGAGVSVCTAFLISVDEIVTNNHCIPGDSPIREAQLTMGYYRHGVLSDTDSYRVVLPELKTSKGLDATVLKVQGAPGEEWGWLEFAETEPVEGDRLIVIHHPAGQVKHITSFGCRAGPRSEEDARVMLHQCDTEKGSSGSPVLNQDGQVVALHYAGTSLRGDGAYNFSKIGTSVKEFTATKAAVRVLESLQPLGLGEIYETFLESSTASRTDLDLCRQLLSVRIQFVPGADIAEFEKILEACWERGVLSRFEYDLAKANAADMRTNLSAFNQSKLRKGSCEQVIRDIRDNNFNSWAVETFRMSAFCGLNSEEVQKVSGNLRNELRALRSFWQNDLDTNGRATETYGRFGIEFTLLMAADRSKLGLPGSTTGVLVSRVESNSVWDRSKISPGDVIQSVNGIQVSSTLQMEKILDALDKPGVETTNLIVYTRGKRRFITISM